MKDCWTPEKIALVATQIAIEMSKGKSIEELNLIKSIASQISCVLHTIISQRIIDEKRCDKIDDKNKCDKK